MMSYQEKRALVSLFSSVLITAIYSAYMLQNYPQEGAYSVEVFRYWGKFLLILIPVSIVTNIMIHIVFSVINTIATKEEVPSITDERDKLIELKATRNSLYTFILGFFLAMGSLVLDMPPSIMFVMLIGSGFLAGVISDISQFYFYRRGV